MDVKLKYDNYGGVIELPYSKSELIRYILLLMQIEEEFIIENINYCEDVITAINIAKSWGSTILELNNVIVIKGRNEPIGSHYDCGESALCLRILICILSRFHKTFYITGKGSLLRRPIGNLLNILSNNGVLIESNGNYLPLTIKGGFKNFNNFYIEEDITSQSITGLLLSLPFVNSKSKIIIRKINSFYHFLHTYLMLKRLNFKINYENSMICIENTIPKIPKKISINVDWSIASIFIASALINGNLILKNISFESFQAEKIFFNILEFYGINFFFKNNSLYVTKQKIPSFCTNIIHSPDLFFPFLILLVKAPKNSYIYGIKNLAYKESNRLIAIKEIINEINSGFFFTKNFISKLNDNDLLPKKKKLVINSFNDHRIVFTFSLMFTSIENIEVIIKKAECVNKSFPNFFDEIKKIGIMYEVLS